GADELVAIDQRGLGVVPAPGAAAEVLPEVLAPLLLALARLQADEVAELADGVEPVPVHRGGAAGALVVAARLADLGVPQHLAGGAAQGEDVGGVALVAHGVDLAPGQGDGREALADAGALPGELGTAPGPALEQALLGGDVVALGPAELRPVGGGREGG